ncbi:MAG TPA: hypothetical protein PLN24_08220 [Victivallales bacterium]|nr:hypothetical protein [Victivallales bacterium]HRU01246.1 hypothetical protein [Victivallales bacterium]
MTYLILFIIIFLFNVTLLGDDKNFFSTSQAFVDRITSNQINENEKKIILEKYQISGLALNDLQIKQIFDFTPNIKDVELLEQVLEFLSSTAKNSLTYQDIQPTLSQLINIFLKENKRTLRNIFRYSQVLCSEPVKITLMEYDCLRRSDQYLKFILTSFPEDMNQLIYDLSDDGLPSIELLNWLSGKLSLDNDLSLTVANYLYEYNDVHDGLTFLRDDHLDSLMQMMASSDDKKRLLSKKILFRITHIENENDWSHFVESKKNPVIETIALEVFSDKSRDIDTRIFASKQIFNLIRYDNRKFAMATPYLLRVLNDKDENIYLKAKCYLHTLNLYMQHFDDILYRKQFLDSVTFLLNDARLHERILCSIDEKMLNEPKVWMKVFDIFTDDNIQIESRAFALFALRLSKKQTKYIAEKGIDFLKEILGSTKKRAINLSLWSLQTLTKTKSSDIEELKKAVSKMPDDPPEEKIKTAK